MADQQRIKRLYPFLRRSPRIDVPETITITETVVETRFQSYGGPYISLYSTKSIFCSDIKFYNPFITRIAVKSRTCFKLLDTTTDFFVVSSYSTTLTAATP